jgi:hypothetical protein
VVVRLARIACLWLALVATAHAEPRTDAGLVWQAPVTCPDAGEVRARIERRLGMPLDRAVHGVEVDIAPGDGGDERGFVAHIDLRGVTVANEIRVLTSARCDALTDAVAVVIARIAAEHLAPPPDEHGAQGARGPRPGLVASAPPRAAPSVWGGGIRVLGVSSIGALPRVGVGGELAGYVRRRSVFVELAGARWLASPKVLHEGAPGRVDVRMNLAALRFGWGPQQLPLRAWVAGEVGSIEGEGISLNDTHVGTGTWVGAGAGVAVTWSMTQHTRLVGMIEAVTPFLRTRFVLQDGTEIYRPGPVTVRCGLGLEIGWR